jgi:hypothetical protein
MSRGALKGWLWRAELIKAVAKMTHPLGVFHE